MRGKRVKALRKAFADKFGRPPLGMAEGPPLADGAIPYEPSERRRLKKAYVKAFSRFGR